MDRFDIALLEAQADSRRSMIELGELVSLSASACHRRICAPEASGYVTGYVAQLDPAALGLALLDFVEIARAAKRRTCSQRRRRTFPIFSNTI